jgi:probable O-glycosylation ligase (exosortase A-associated)
MMVYVGLLLFFVLEYVRPANYVEALLPLRLNSIVPLSTFMGTVIARGQDTLAFIFSEANTWVVLSLLGLVGLSVLTADVTEYAYTGFITLLGYAMAYWMMMSELTTIARIKGVVITLIAIHLIVAALNPVLFTDPDSRHYLQSGFFLGDGNDFALSLNVVVPLCLFLLLDSKQWLLKGVWAGALVILVAGNVLTKSRGGTLALAAMAVYYWLGSDKKFQTAAIGAALFVLILSFAPASYFERMNMINIEEESAASRVTAWKVATQMALTYPILGVGAGHFGVKYGLEFHPKDALEGEMTAHSLYFLALGELGFPGLAVVLFFFGSNIVANRRLRLQIQARGGPGSEKDVRLLMATSAGLIAFAAGGAFLSCLYYPHLYVLCGLLAATRRVLRAQRADSPAAETAKPAEMTLHWALRRPAAPAARQLRR